MALKSGAQPDSPFGSSKYGTSNPLGSLSLEGSNPRRLLMTRFRFQPRSPDRITSLISQSRPQAALINSTTVSGATLAKKHMTRELNTVRQFWWMATFAAFSAPPFEGCHSHPRLVSTCPASSSTPNLLPRLRAPSARDAPKPVRWAVMFTNCSTNKAFPQSNANPPVSSLVIIPLSYKLNANPIVLLRLMVSIPYRSHSSPNRVAAFGSFKHRFGPNPTNVSYSGPLRLTPSSRRTTLPQAITQAWQVLKPARIVSVTLDPVIWSSSSNSPLWKYFFGISPM